VRAYTLRRLDSTIFAVLTNAVAWGIVSNNSKLVELLVLS